MIIKSGQQNVPVQQQINRVGAFLFKNIDGAYKFEKTANMYDLYFLMLYEVPKMQRIPGKAKEGYNDTHEMRLNLNITTYQNKIRVNLIEITPEERTLGHMVIPPEKTQNLQYLKDFIEKWILKRLKVFYSDYEFIY